MPVENEEPLDYAAAAKSLMLKPADSKPEAVDYGAAARELVQGRAAVNLKAVEGSNAETAARALDLSKRSGLPLPAVEGSEDEVGAQLRSATVAEALDKAPVTRLWFNDPVNAKIAHDDAESLTALEHVWNVGRGFASGLVDTPGMTARGIGEMYGVADRAVRRPVFAALEAIGATDVVDALKAPIPWWLSPEKILTRPGEVIGDVAKAAGPAPEAQNFATDVASGLGQMTAQITAAILSGGASSAVSMAGLLGQGASQQADMVAKAGKSGTPEGDSAILLGAGITAVTERYGLDAMLERIPNAIKTRIGRMLAGFGSEALQEVTEGVLQNLTAVALYDPENPLFDGLTYQGAVAGTAGAIVQALIPGRHAHSAKAGKEQMDEANKAALESKLNERSPEKFGELHGAMLRDQGIDKIGIPAAKLQEFLQSNEGIDQGEWLRNLGVADQMDEALAMGGDVELTPEAYSEHILGTDHYAKLSDHIRMEQDGLTPAEADEWQKTGLKDEIARMAEDMASLDPETAAGIAQIQSEVEAKLKAAGEASDSATYAAILTAQRYATRAERAGTTPLAMWAADNLQVVRGESGRAPVTNVDLTIDKARSADAAGFLKLSKTPVLDMLAARGGVDPDSTLAAELRHVGVEPKTKRGLFKKGGMGAAIDTRQATLDAGGEVAGPRGIDNIVRSETPLFDDTQDNGTGYISPEEIIAAVRDELAGNPKRSTDERTAIDQFNADINWLSDTVNAHNDQTGGTISLATSTPEEIKAAVAAMEGQGFEQGGTESAAFKAWFGDSKVVDAEGKPLVVYHGTDVDFSEFSKEKVKSRFQYSIGFHFTDRPTEASIYATGVDTSEIADGGQVMPVYIRAENPLVITTEQVSASMEADLNRAEIIHKLLAARDAGTPYDSVIIKRARGDEYDGMNVIVFEPTQIKSALNRGTFDGKSANILEQPAYHGTPHSFDKFSTDHIGTGEGAQAYGWGLYFAGKKEVAEYYKTNLAGDMSVVVDGHARVPENYKLNGQDVLGLYERAVNRQEYGKAEVLERILMHKNPAQLRAIFNSDEYPPETVAFAKSINEANLTASVDGKAYPIVFETGRLYEVDIPDDSDMLDVDKPLPRQSAKVRAILKASGVLKKVKAAHSDFGLPQETKARNGRGLYAVLAAELGSDKAASQYLHSIGIPGLRYKAGQITGAKGGGHNYVIFDDSLVSIKSYEQPARGSIQFTPESIIIRLGAMADRSTFLHESGHLYLEQLRADAKAYGAVNPALVDDLNTVNDWFAGNAASIKAEAITAAKKAKDKAAVATLEKMTDAAVSRSIKLGTPDSYIASAMHEQWARGTEDYWRTGQAPSVALQEAFNRFRAWLVSIYRALKGRGLDVEFSPDVKEVMDRLLATDEEIALVQEQYNLKALFGSAEEIGMTPKQFASYQASVAKASDAAKTAQLKKHIHQVERAKLEWWREERAKLRETVAVEVQARQVYLTMYALSRGTLPNGDALPMKPGRLDRAATVAVLENEASLSRLPRINKRGVIATPKKEDGSHPDVIGQMYGYEDGRAMLVDLMNAEPIETAIDAETDSRMKAEYGDMMIDGTAIDEALESTHNDKRGELLAAELNALRDSGPKMKPAFVRAWAAERIGTRKVDDIQPGKFLAAEKRYGREAGKLLRAGDRLGAQKAKFQQLLNFYMAKESYKVRAEVDKARKYMDGFNLASRKFPTIEADYIDNIRAILDAYQLGARLSERNKTKLEMAAVAEWIQRKNTDDGALLEVPQRILDANEKTHYRDLTLDEFRTLHDSIKNIEAQGKNAKTAIIDGEERDIAEMSNEIVERLETRPQTKRMARKAVEQNPGLGDRILSKLAGWDAAMRKVEFLLEIIDGEKNGPAHRYIFQVFADAQVAREDLTKRVTAVIMRGLDGLPKKQFAEKINVPLLGRTFRRSDLIMMALNVGNDSNYQKMLDGSAKDSTIGALAWTEAGIDEALAHLTAEEWTFVQTVWDSFESMYPQVRDVYRRENGIAPEKVDAREIETRHGQTLRGGYFPMMYDPSRSEQGKAIESKNAIESMQSPAVKASVFSGMTKARTGFSAPVLLDIAALPNHIEKTAHFVTHYDAVRAVNRLIGKRDFSMALKNRVGLEYYNELKEWVGALAANGQPTAGVDDIGKVIEAARANATVAFLGASATTILAQPLGLYNVVDALARNRDGSYSPRKGALWMARGMVQYLKSPAVTHHQVVAASGEMRHGLQNIERDMRHTMKLLAGKSGGWAKFQQFVMYGIAYTQFFAIDIPTWLGAYNRALAEGVSESDAVREADNIVRTTQGRGGIKDLSAVQRAPGTARAFTMFYSPFNVLYNLQAEAIGKVKGAKDVPQLAARALLLMTLPAVMDAVFKMDFPDDDEDYPAWLALKTALYGFSSMVVLRDLVGGVAGAYGYSATPLASFGENLAKSVKGWAKALDDGDVTAATLKATVMAAGLLVGAPAVQINRFIGAADAMMDDRDVGPYDFAMGYKKPK